MMPCQGARVISPAAGPAGPLVDSSTGPPGSWHVTGPPEKLARTVRLPAW